MEENYSNSDESSEYEAPAINLEKHNKISINLGIRSVQASGSPSETEKSMSCNMTIEKEEEGSYDDGPQIQHSVFNKTQKFSELNMVGVSKYGRN
jgi:hypothetical protein